MEYCGNPLNLELINDIVEIPSVEEVLRMESFLRYITNKFEKPYVLLLLSKGKDADEQAAIFDAIEEEYYREEILDAECIPNRYPNAISTDELRKIEFQLKYKHKAIEPDFGVLIQAYIYRQYPESKIFKLRGDWYRVGDDVFGDVVNWVTDYCVNACEGQVGEIYGDGSNITRLLYDLRSKNWCSRLNIEDFLQVLEPAIDHGASLLENYEFKHFYQNLFQDPWTLDPTTPYAQKRQSIIDELLAEHQCNYDSDLPMNEEAECGEIDSLKSELDAAKARIRELEDEVAELRSQQPKKIDVEAAIADLCPRYFNDKDVAREFVAFAEGKEDSLIAARIRLYKDRKDLVYSNRKELCDILKKHHLWKTKDANFRSYLRKE